MTHRFSKKQQREAAKREKREAKERRRRKVSASVHLTKEAIV
jgi:hypothetical protein